MTQILGQATLFQSGGLVDFTPSGADTLPGDVVVQGSLIGVSSLLIEDSELGSINTDGIFDIVKITGAISAGAEVYWDATGNPVGGVAGSGAATATAGSNALLGWCTEDAASGDSQVRVKLANVQGVNVQGDLSATITDPGDAGAIPVTGQGTCDMTSGGAETRTLAAPSFVGQMISLTHAVDGGAIILTCATTVNQTGDNTLTFTEADDAIVLYAITAAGPVLEWRVLANDGVVPSTV